MRIFDTTLRDGEQTPGVSLSPQQKLDIAQKLDDLGVDAIEAGFPVISKGEAKAIKMISCAGLEAQVCGLARANRADIDAVADTGLQYVHTFIATSDIHLEYKLHMSRDDAHDRAVDAVEYAKSRGMQVEFSAEDATRTDRDFLRRIFVDVTKAGADRLDIPDTVGYSTPQYLAQIVRETIDSTKLPVSVHCHNDFGLAVANAISGVQAGAECAHVTINGIGERAGNTSLEEFTMALKCLNFEKEWSTNIKSEMLYDISRYVSKIFGIPVQPNKSIVGENAFGHESGIHTHGVLNNPLTYEPIKPELVGRRRSMKVGKHAGMHGMLAILAEFGINPDKNESEEILKHVKQVADTGKKITDVELASVAIKQMGAESSRKTVTLAGLEVSTGLEAVPRAKVTLEIGGQEHTGNAEGVGPVDAALNAIQKITGETSKVRITKYNLDSISGGSGAMCEVTVEVEDATSHTISARHVGKDIVTTSVEAVLDAINLIMLKNTRDLNV